MINELIEKEMNKIGEHQFLVDEYGQIEACCLCHNLSRKKLTKDFAQIIAKEVAMRFKEEFETTDGMWDFADQIINEVSKDDWNVPILEQERGEL